MLPFDIILNWILTVARVHQEVVDNKQKALHITYYTPLSRSHLWLEKKETTTKKAHKNKEKKNDHSVNMKMRTVIFMLVYDLTPSQ